MDRPDSGPDLKLRAQDCPGKIHSVLRRKGLEASGLLPHTRP